jgi:hypothetical protein
MIKNPKINILSLFISLTKYIIIELIIKTIKAKQSFKYPNDIFIYIYKDIFLNDYIIIPIVKNNSIDYPLIYTDFININII